MSWRRILSQKPTIAHLLIQFSVFYRTRKFIIIFSTACDVMQETSCNMAASEIVIRDGGISERVMSDVHNYGPHVQFISNTMLTCQI